MAVQETPIKKLTHNNAVDAEIVEHNGRFVIVNGKNGEIIENCNGWGYKTREKAYSQNFFKLILTISLKTLN